MNEVDFFDKMKKGLSDAGAKAKDMVDITKLNNHIGQKQREIEQLYNQIGQATFKAVQDNALSSIEEAAKGFSQEIVKKQEEIAELEREIAEIRKADDNAPKAKSPEVKSPETESPKTGSDEAPDQKVCTTCGQVVHS
jgi:predicted  nucleic acid-binding Zn-ribbon protein